MTRTLARRGFTLIELLVVIAIIAVLMALLLPAIQKVREAANKMLCQSNMRQLVLAMHNYHNDYNRLPPSLLIDLNPGAALAPFPFNAHGWGTYLLPYIEQDALFRQYNFQVPFPAAPPLTPLTINNVAVISSFIKLMACPSASRSDLTYTGGSAAEGNFYIDNTSFPPFRWRGAVSDYAPLDLINPSAATFFGYPAGSEVRSALRPVARGPAAALAGFGLLPSGGSMTLGNLSNADGSSNTIALAENAGRPNYFVRRTLVSTRYVDGAGWGDLNAEFGLDGATFSGTDPIAFTTPGNCVVNCHNNNEVYAFHSGLANIAFGDGSTRSVPETVNPRVFAALITSQGGETITGEDIP